MKKVLFTSMLMYSSAYAFSADSPDQSQNGSIDESISNLPALELGQLPILDLSTGKPFLRALTEEEMERTSIYLREKRENSDPTLRNLFNGDCFNNSGYWAGIYGPKVSTRPYDNDVYMVPPGYKTPDGWDCDGFYIPRDVTLLMTPAEIHQGPGAAKIVNLQWGVLESISRFERKVDASILIWVAASTGTNWYFPNFPQQDLDDLGDTWLPRPPIGR